MLDTPAEVSFQGVPGEIPISILNDGWVEFAKVENTHDAYRDASGDGSAGKSDLLQQGRFCPMAVGLDAILWESGLACRSAQEQSHSNDERGENRKLQIYLLVSGREVPSGSCLI